MDRDRWTEGSCKRYIYMDIDRWTERQCKRDRDRCTEIDVQMDHAI